MERYFKSKELENGLIREYNHPHTADIAHLDSALCAPLTAQYYLLCRYFGYEIPGEEVLTSLKEMQDTDSDSEMYGCMRWYREELRILDTNGAFFSLMPLSIAMTFYPDKIPSAEQKIIKTMFFHARTWFLHECKSYGLFYPNKVVSEGALLSAIGFVTDDEDTKKESVDFWHSWLSYTEEYGWGWGENLSSGYANITVEALNLALGAHRNDALLSKKLCEVRNSLLDYADFHGYYEYVPTIRSYNFTGECEKRPRSTYSLEEIRQIDGEDEARYGPLMSHILRSQVPAYIPNMQKETMRKERIFGDSYAATYRGKHIRLGTVSHFPVMPGCYQNDGWGLGWQSMPVSAMAMGHEFSFLRYACCCGGELYAHPKDVKQKGFHTSLFDDKNIPDVDIACHQSENTAVIVKQMRHIANKSSYLADEWFIPFFTGVLRKHKEWYAADYGECILAIRPVGCDAQVISEGGSLRIAQQLYSGEETFLVQRQWITCWAVAVIDDACDWEKQLDDIPVAYNIISDLRIPREASPFCISCGEAALKYDPDSAFLFSCTL